MNKSIFRSREGFGSMTALIYLLGAGCVPDEAPAGTSYALGSLPDLGAAETFALLAGTTVTATGMAMIIGDVGVSPGTAIIGFPPATISMGSFHAGDAVSAMAQSDLTTAYNDVAGQACDTVLTGVDLGGMTLMPGVYCFATSAQLTGTLTLNGMGDPNAIFVFQIGSTLTTASSSAVVMIGSAIPGRVFWQVGSSATLGTGTAFSGNILAMVSITATTGSSIAGRALARTGAVTVDGVNGEAVPLDPPMPPLLDAGMDAGDANDAAVGDASDLGGLSGGSYQCAAAHGASGRGAPTTLILLGLLFASLAWRRRGGLASASALGVAIIAFVAPGAAHADSVTLDQFRPAETTEDGIEVSRPVDLGHRRVGATAYLVYAHNPLVYEADSGNLSTQDEAIVRNQLGLHVGMAYGVFDRLVLFAGVSGNLVMEGETRPGYVEADGARVGDTTIGARVRLIGTPELGERRYAALAFQLGLSVPTARWIASGTQLTGDQHATVTPELLGEVGGEHLRVTANIGTRLRTTENVSTLSVSHELTWSLGLGVPLIGKALELDIEAFGTTAITHPFERETTPMEALGGLRWRGETGWTAALAAGTGLTRGYGSPNFRSVATVGWTRPAPAPVVIAEPDHGEPVEEPIAEAPAPDTDGDGVPDALDDCPRVAGATDNRGCLRFVQIVPTETGIAEIVILTRIEFATDESGTLLAVTVATLDEVRAVLEANPQIRRVAVEGHSDERATDAYNMTLSRDRADAVVRWLVAHGIESSRLEARGFGEREPFAAGTSLDAQQTNRNVQFFVLDPPASSPSRPE